MILDVLRVILCYPELLRAARSCSETRSRLFEHSVSDDNGGGHLPLSHRRILVQINQCPTLPGFTPPHRPATELQIEIYELPTYCAVGAASLFSGTVVGDQALGGGGRGGRGGMRGSWRG